MCTIRWLWRRVNSHETITAIYAGYPNLKKFPMCVCRCVCVCKCICVWFNTTQYRSIFSLIFEHMIQYFFYWIMEFKVSFIWTFSHLLAAPMIHRGKMERESLCVNVLRLFLLHVAVLGYSVRNLQQTCVRGCVDGCWWWIFTSGASGGSLDGIDGCCWCCLDGYCWWVLLLGWSCFRWCWRLLLMVLGLW